MHVICSRFYKTHPKTPKTPKTLNSLIALFFGPFMKRRVLITCILRMMTHQSQSNEESCQNKLSQKTVDNFKFQVVLALPFLSISFVDFDLTDIYLRE